MLPLLQGGLERASLNDDRLGQILEALFAAQLNRVFGAIALNALEVYALLTPWLHQDTTTGLDHGVGHFRSLSITQQRHWLTYRFIAARQESLCQVF